MTNPDFFRARLVDMIDFRHPLAFLATRMPWAALEAMLNPAFARSDRPGQTRHVDDWFGTQLTIAGAGVAAAGRRAWDCC